MHESGLGHAPANPPALGGREPSPASASLLAGRTDRPQAGLHRKFLERNFYLGMSLLVAGVVAFGFSRTIGANLLHPDTPRPTILYIHAWVFSGWVALFMLQSALARARHIALHRTVGTFGACLGSVLPLLGLATALVMQHWHAQRVASQATGLSLPFNDMLTFSIAFGLAIRWRRRPEFHRRLMLIATCCLTGAAFARFPEYLVPDNAFYLCVDLLVLLGVWRDWALTRHVHVVYRRGLPCLVASQALAQYLMLYTPAIWVAFTRHIMEWTWWLA
ncbi:hypothetical protein [Dyella sp. C9]|uniref:hypothetical protein n=1 Tax=Dyella sp. C9 TaxID=2202154 RepID=UPI0013003FF3|nr:hypothetical protein [Dyella sp. C9]